MFMGITFPLASYASCVVKQNLYQLTVGHLWLAFGDVKQGTDFDGESMEALSSWVLQQVQHDLLALLIPLFLSSFFLINTWSIPHRFNQLGSRLHTASSAMGERGGGSYLSGGGGWPPGRRSLLFGRGKTDFRAPFRGEALLKSPLLSPLWSSKDTWWGWGKTAARLLPATYTTSLNQ